MEHISFDYFFKVYFFELKYLNAKFERTNLKLSFRVEKKMFKYENRKIQNHGQESKELSKRLKNALTGY